jgi:hypothetical protein
VAEFKDAINQTSVSDFFDFPTLPPFSCLNQPPEIMTNLEKDARAQNLHHLVLINYGRILSINPLFRRRQNEWKIGEDGDLGVFAALAAREYSGAGKTCRRGSQKGGRLFSSGKRPGRNFNGA